MDGHILFKALSFKFLKNYVSSKYFKNSKFLLDRNQLNYRRSKEISYYCHSNAPIKLWIQPFNFQVLKSITNYNISCLNQNQSSLTCSTHFQSNRFYTLSFVNRNKKEGEELYHKKHKLDASQSEPKLSLVQKFKQMYKQYWYVLLPVHVITSTVWFVTFFFAAKSGVDIVPTLEYFGASEKITSYLSNSDAGYYGLAYAMYKLATPARYMVTVGGTTLSINYLRNRGHIKPVPTKEELKVMYADKKEELLEKKEELREKYVGKKMEIKERTDEIKEKYQEKKDQYIEKKEEFIDKFKSQGKSKKS